MNTWLPIKHHSVVFIPDDYRRARCRALLEELILDTETSEAIRLTTRAYNAALERFVLRRPEQWYWVHRRWKHAARRARKRMPDTASA